MAGLDVFVMVYEESTDVPIYQVRKVDGAGFKVLHTAESTESLRRWLSESSTQVGIPETKVIRNIMRPFVAGKYPSTEMIRENEKVIAYCRRAYG